MDKQIEDEMRSRFPDWFSVYLYPNERTESNCEQNQNEMNTSHEIVLSCITTCRRFTNKSTADSLVKKIADEILKTLGDKYKSRCCDLTIKNVSYFKVFGATWMGVQVLSDEELEESKVLQVEYKIVCYRSPHQENPSWFEQFLHLIFPSES